MDKFISTHDLFPVMLSMMHEGHKVAFTISGYSMWPFLAQDRDKVILESVKTEELKVGDIILFQRPDNEYALHRITRIRQNYFESTGDGNCFRDGWFPMSCIKAKAITLIRKDKPMSCNSLFWKSVFYLWMKLYPIRRILLRTLKLISKIKN